MKNIRMMSASEEKLKNKLSNVLLHKEQSRLIRDPYAKKGYGGTSTLDAPSFYRRRPDVDTEIVEFDDWMSAKAWKKEVVEEHL